MKVSAAGNLAMPEEHPLLFRAAAALLSELDALRSGLTSVDGASIWLHHLEWAERASELVSHLRGALLLAGDRRHPSAFTVLRTALEHTCIDELLVHGELYREVFRTDRENAQLLKTEFEAGSAEWARDVTDLTLTRQGIRITKRGYEIVDPNGDIVEHVSPWNSFTDNHHATLGRVDAQASLSNPFEDSNRMRDWARRNAELYRLHLSWSAIIDNLRLNGRLNDRELAGLEVHYRFLSSFTHATVAGYRASTGRGNPDLRPAARHMLDELVLLYVCSIASSEVHTFTEHVDSRPNIQLLRRAALDRARTDADAMASYFWFPRLGAPTNLDYVAEAHSRLTHGGRPTFPITGLQAPESIPEEEVSYYRDPLSRLIQLHVGLREFTTGLGHDALW